MPDSEAKTGEVKEDRVCPFMQHKNVGYQTYFDPCGHKHVPSSEGVWFGNCLGVRCMAYTSDKTCRRTQ